jgi:secreted PhoX family phosphatase
LIRWWFLTFLGTESAALAAGSARVLTNCAQGEEHGSKDQGSRNGESASTDGKTGGKPTSFQPIEFSDTDELVLHEGFRYEIIHSSGARPTTKQVYRDHNDYAAYLPIDAREGSEDPEDGILWVNHEYINPMFWSTTPTPRVRSRRRRSR